MERRSKIALLVVLTVAFAIRLGTALAFPNIYHPDEVYQYLEQGHRLAFGSGVVPWEFREGIRSWIIPGFLAGVMRASAWVSDSPTAHVTGAMAALTALSLSVVATGFLWARGLFGLRGAVITGVVCAVWFELILFAPKALSEAVAAHLLLCGLFLVYPEVTGNSRSRFFFAGVVLGLAVALRIHLGPAIAVATVFLCRREFRDRWVPLVLGQLSALAFAALLDMVTWGRPLQSIWLYVWRSLIQGVSASTGVQPWYFYLDLMLRHWSGIVVVIAGLVVLGARRLPLLAGVAATVLVTHSLIPHKEYRYMYPTIVLLIVLVGVGSAELAEYLRPSWRSSAARWAVAAGLVGFWLVVSASLAVGKDFRHLWFRYSAAIHAARYVGQQTDACGVGLVNMEWFDTAGYVHLHRNVPMYLSRLGPDLEKAAPGFNYALSNWQVIPYTDLRRVRCWEDSPWFKPVCVHRRAGMCRGVPEFEINRVLVRLGE